MKTRCSITIAIALVFGLNAHTSADLIAHWTFETSVPLDAGPHVAELGLQAGTAEATGFHATGVTTYSNPVGNGSLESFSANNWTTLGDYYQFQVNLTGYTSAIISWEQTRSGTGPTNFDLQISIDGTNFTTVLGNYPVAQVTWTSASYTAGSAFGPISLTNAVDNQASVFVRMSSRSVVASTGTNRVDDVRIEATPIPEPGTLSLLGLAIAGLGFVRSRR